MGILSSPGTCGAAHSTPASALAEATRSQSSTQPTRATGPPSPPTARSSITGFANNGSNQDLVIVRMSYDGVLETSFGFGGKVSVNFAGANDYGYAMAAFTIDEQRLRTTVAFNYEAKNSYSIRVRSTDADASVRGCPCPGSRRWRQAKAGCRKRGRQRVNGGQDARSERPATGLGGPEPRLTVSTIGCSRS